VRPYLAKDGGNVEIVEITSDNILKVKLIGACQSCPQSFLTLKSGIEDAVRAAVPNIVSVEAVNI
jgi:Fe-S cluster biogenesis protein NfuA